MIPEGTRVSFLNYSTILMGDVLLSNKDSVVVVVTDKDGWKAHHTVPVVSLDEVFVDKVYTVIVTDPSNGKTRAKSFYVKEKAESYHRKAFEKSYLIVHFVEHTICSWILFQKSAW